MPPACVASSISLCLLGSRSCDCMHQISVSPDRMLCFTRERKALRRPGPCRLKRKRGGAPREVSRETLGGLLGIPPQVANAVSAPCPGQSPSNPCYARARRDTCSRSAPLVFQKKNLPSCPLRSLLTRPLRHHPPRTPTNTSSARALGYASHVQPFFGIVFIIMPERGSLPRSTLLGLYKGREWRSGASTLVAANRGASRRGKPVIPGACWPRTRAHLHSSAFSLVLCRRRAAAQP